MIQRKLEVTYQPFDRTTRVPPGTTLFSAAHWIGLPIDSTCGGRGTCGKCKVRVIDGTAEVTTADHRLLRKEEIEGGWRLSCQTRIYDDITCEVPQLLRVPKAATMGLGRLVILDPNVRKVYLELAEPTLEDQRSDVMRLRDALTAEGHDMVAGVPVMRTIPRALRDSGFKVTAVLGGEQLVALEPGDTTGECFGVAFDVGTTTLVGTLMNLRTGMAAGVLSTLNGQAPFGADVISRISHGMNGPDSVLELQAAVVATMNSILADLYLQTGVSRDRTYEAVVVGNATMLHLLFGIDPSPLAVMPFTPAFMEPLLVAAPVRWVSTFIPTVTSRRCRPSARMSVQTSSPACSRPAWCARTSCVSSSTSAPTARSCSAARSEPWRRRRRPARPSRAARSAAACEPRKARSRA